MIDVTPIVRRKLSQDVFDRLLQRISDGEFPARGIVALGAPLDGNISSGASRGA